MALEPLARSRHRRVVDLGCAADDLPLVDLLDVDAELREPAIAVRDGRVHPHRAAADPAERRSAQRLHGRARANLLFDPGERRRIADVAPGAPVRASDLIEGAGGCEHPDHPRVLRVDVGEEKQRAGQLAGRREP